jgi:hypothetical protein
MSTQLAKDVQKPDEIVDLLLHRTSKSDLRRLVEIASAASGQPVSARGYEPGDDICPTWKFPFPFPPKFGDFLQTVTHLGGISEVFPLGILNPEAVLVQARFGRAE